MPLSFEVNTFEILKIWKGGMSFHGAVVGIIITISGIYVLNSRTRSN